MSHTPTLPATLSLPTAIPGRLPLQAGDHLTAEEFPEPPFRRDAGFEESRAD